MNTPRTFSLLPHLEAIARKELGVQTLSERGRDALDFYDLGVYGIARALEAAFKLGQQHPEAVVTEDAPAS